MPADSGLRKTYSITNFVIEYRNSRGHEWRTLDSSADNEADVRERFETWMKSASRSGMHIRVVKRVAVITDQVITAFCPGAEEEN